MVAISLGTRSLVIGANPVTFNAFNYESNRAYGFYCFWTVDNFDNIFSRVEISALLNPGIGQRFLGEDIKTPPISPIPSTFLYAFSPLYFGDGTCRFLAQRLSNIRGSADAETTISLEIFYDDAVSVPSWRA